MAKKANHQNEHREEDTETLRFKLQQSGELTVSAIGPDAADKMLKRVKAIVRSQRGDLRKLVVSYDPERKVVEAKKP